MSNSPVYEYPPHTGDAKLAPDSGKDHHSDQRDQEPMGRAGSQNVYLPPNFVQVRSLSVEVFW